MTSSSAPCGKGMRSKCQGFRVKEQRFAVASEAGRHLVHDADGRPDEIRFRALCQSGERDVVVREAEHGTQRSQQAHLQGGARGHPAAHGDGRIGSEHRNPAAVSTADSDRRHSLDIVEPASTGSSLADVIFLDLLADVGAPRSYTLRRSVGEAGPVYVAE